MSLAVYPGFFDPFTLGHLNIVERGIAIFDKIIVAVAADSPKQSMFSPAERQEMIQDVFKDQPKVEIDQFRGLLVDYVRKNGHNLILRGIRTVSDFEYEYQMALANRTLTHEVETFFMMTEGSYSYLSSTVIKEVARLGGDVSEMVPAQVLAYVKRKYASK